MKLVSRGVPVLFPLAAAAALLIALFPARATDAPATGFPGTDEMLDYSINWPTGLSLGEAHLKARKNAERWEFDFNLSASIPGFPVRDHYRSVANKNLCSLEFDKEFTHGQRKAQEKTTFDYGKATAERSTLKGGKSQIPISDCARDALDFLYFARRELGQGRVPPEQTVLAGAPYQVKMEYSGVRKVRVNDKPRDAEQFSVTVKGPKADLNFEIFFARDAARTPLMVRVPFSLGTFSMELVR